MRVRRDNIQTLIMISLAIVPLIFIPIGEGDYFYLPKVFVLRLIVMTYLLVIYKYRNNLRDIISTDGVNQILLLYFLWLVFSTIFSIDVYNSIIGNPNRIEGLSTLILYFALFLIARQQGTISKRNVYMMVFVGCIIALYGILQSYGLEFFPRDLVRETWIKAISTIGNPNFLASYIVLLLPFSVHLFLVEKDKFGLVAYAILFFGLLATLTRGAWVGAFLSILVYGVLILYHRNRFEIQKKNLVIFIIVTILCLITYDISSSGNLVVRFLSVFNDFGIVITGGENLEDAGANRIFIWLRTIELIRLRPLFGFGLENLQIAFNQYFKDDILSVFNRPALVDKAHNEYLHIAVSSGIPALLIYLSFITIVIRKGISRLLELPYAIPLLIAVIGYLVQAFFNISVVSVAYIFWVFLGFMASNRLIE